MRAAIASTFAFRFRSSASNLLPQAAARTMTTTTAASKSSSSSSDDDDNRVRVRILCLHGKGGDGRRFVDSSLMPLRSLVDERFGLAGGGDGGNGDDADFADPKVRFEWEAITAPYEMDGGEDGGGAGYSWWTMPPGVRSYDAKEYEGFDVSAAMVMEKLFPSNDDDDGATVDACNNVDIVLGHSQGAILAAALLSTRERLRSPSSPGGGPMAYILNGVAWPNPYAESLLSLAATNDDDDDGRNNRRRRRPPRVMFVMGENDGVNPVESASRVYDAYDAANFDVSVARHGGGHSVPAGRDDDSRRALGEVVDWIAGVAEEKLRRCSAAVAGKSDNNGGSARVFVYGTLKRGHFNHDKWMGPNMIQRDDVASADEFVSTYCQQQSMPPSCDIETTTEAAGARGNEGPIYDDAAERERRMEAILASGPRAYPLSMRARIAEGTRVSLYADKYFIPYAVLDSNGGNGGDDEGGTAEDARAAPLHGELYLVNEPMLALLDELEGISTGRYVRSEVAVAVATDENDSTHEERAFLYNYIGSVEGLERIAEYDLQSEKEKYVPPLER